MRKLCACSLMSGRNVLPRREFGQLLPIDENHCLPDWESPPLGSFDRSTSCNTTWWDRRCGGGCFVCLCACDKWFLGLAVAEIADRRFFFFSFLFSPPFFLGC